MDREEEYFEGDNIKIVKIQNKKFQSISSVIFYLHFVQI